MIRLWAIGGTVFGPLRLIARPFALGGPMVLIDFRWARRGWCNKHPSQVHQLLLPYRLY